MRSSASSRRPSGGSSSGVDDPDQAVVITAVPGGVRLRLRVKPSARADRLVGGHGGALKMEVRAAPEHGKANNAVAAVMADGLQVRRKDVAITAGLGSRNKSVIIRGLSVGDVVSRLEALGIPAKAGS